MGSLTQVQKSVIVGSILGDGYLRIVPGRKNALLEINSSFAQKEYVNWKCNHLRNFIRSLPKSRKGKGVRISYRFNTRCHPELTELYFHFYKDKKRVIPEDLNLDKLTLAVWFMDDGSKTYNALYLNTQQFDLRSQKKLQDILLNQWRIKTTLNKDKIYYRIRVRTESTPRFKKIVKPYVLNLFSYKLE